MLIFVNYVNYFSIYFSTFQAPEDFKARHFFLHLKQFGLSSFGRIVIEINEDNLFAKNFTERCIASKNKSYIGSGIVYLDVHDFIVIAPVKDPLVEISETEKNAVEKVHVEKRNVYVPPWKYSYSLYIATKNVSDLSLPKIGRVVEGFDLLKERDYRGINLFVSGCGEILDY